MAVDRLTADDRLVLWSDTVWPQDVGAVAVLDGDPLLEPDGRFRIEDARAAVARRVHVMPRLRQVLRVPRRGLGWPFWVDAHSFELRYHVRAAHLPPDSDEAAFLQAVEDVRSHRLDPTRPLWEMWFFPGLAERRVGLFIRLHHVMADGIAGVAGIASLLDVGPEARRSPAPAWTPEPAPSTAYLLVDNVRRRGGEIGRTLGSVASPARSLRHLAAAWPAARELLGGRPATATSLDGLVGPRRRLALVRASMEEVTRVAHTHDATVNDVLLALIAGGVRALLRSRGEPVDGVVLPIYVPMSLRRQGRGAATGNRITQVVVPLPVGLPDPVARLHRITAATTERKAVARPSLGAMFRSKVLSGAMLKLIIRQRINLLSADLPGPAAPLYLAGARVLEVFPLLNLVGNMTLGVGALSYASQFHVLVVGDGDLYPDLAVFAGGLAEELPALAVAHR